MTPKAWATKEKKSINWTLSKFKTFVHHRALSGKGKGNHQLCAEAATSLPPGKLLAVSWELSCG